MLARPALPLILPSLPRSLVAIARLIAMGSLVTLGACAPAMPPAASGAARTTALPAVDVLRLDGTQARIDATLAGRPALVTLWATWCEACEGELPALGRLDARLSSSGGDGRPAQALVVGVAVGEERRKVAAFVERHGMRYAQLVDEDFRFADALGQRRVPTTLVIDRGGRVVYTGGALDAAALRALQSAMN